jgi:hypothetical protein
VTTSLWTTRSLTDAERTELTARLRSVERDLRFSLLRFVAAATLVGGLLCVFTLALSSASRVVVVAFWLAITALVTVWTWLESRGALSRAARELRAALAFNTVRAIDVRASAVAEFGEFEDEGACYAFQLPGDQLLFISGQQYNESGQWPCAHFSIVEVLTADYAPPFTELLTCHSPKLPPALVIDPLTKMQLAIPDHLSVISGHIEQLELLLRR